jgi:RNA polymerase sigma-70 factor (ECF subfamily)
VGDHSTAEDLVSEVFEKVLLKYCTYNPEKAKLSTWLFTIVNNTIINYFKKNDRHLESLELEKIESSYRLEDLVVEREQKELLLKAIMGLNERQRNIIALKFGACLTNREIAQLTDLSESNVGTILYRALKLLKGKLTGQGAITND